MDTHQPPTPAWDVPTPYDYHDAATIAGSVAAPLLAGFTVSLIGIVIGYGSKMRLPGVALDVLSAAAIALIASVQLCFMARMYLVTPDQIESWWPDHEDPTRRAQLITEQATHTQTYTCWSRRFRWAYNLGVLLLLAGVAVTLVPPDNAADSARWLAVGIVAAGFVGELAWILGGWAQGRGEPWWQRS